MAERIDMPPALQGDEQSQIRQIWKYLYQVAEKHNRNMESIGGNELNDEERKIMNGVLESTGNEHISLKKMVIKTAEYAQRNK